MGQLQLLWQFQKHDRRILKFKRELEELRRGKEIEALNVKLRQREYDLTHTITEIDVNNAKIQRNSNKLNQMIFNLKELEEKLYSGSISEINQLNQINKETKDLKSKLSNLEGDTLKLMEYVEKLEKKRILIDKEYREIKKRLEDFLEEQSKEIERLTKNISSEKEKCDTIALDIDEKAMNKYNKLKATKKRAVVEVDDKRCTGCHMDIPLSLLSQIKKNDTINYCDNCNRILYYNKED